MNNHDYGTERHLHEGAFNDIGEWCYSQLPAVLGDGEGFVTTEGELSTALEAGLQNTDSFTIIDVQLDKLDCSPALTRLAEWMSMQL